MNDFYLSNRTLLKNYHQYLQQKFDGAIHPDEIAGPGQTDPQPFYLEFKNRILELVHQETEKQKDELQSSDNCHLLLLKHTALVDAVVRTSLRTALWLYNHLHQKSLEDKEVPIAIIARGGYGREEMYFKSDVDLQVVSRTPNGDQESEFIKKIVSYFEYLFTFQDIFDTGGSSCYSDTQALQQEFDVNKMPQFFSLMEHRLVAGSPMVHAELKSAIKTSSLMHKEAILKYCYQHKTYYDVQNTVFQQEPNIKEELRRLYWALALVRVRESLENNNQFELLFELLTKNILSTPAFKDMQVALNFLAKIRLFLHCTQSGAQRDVLRFEVRETIAGMMGYEVKEFFKEYFFHAAYPLKKHSRNLFWESMVFDAQKVKTLSDHFALNAENQIIIEKDPEKLFSESPQSIFRIFTWVAEENHYLSYPLTRLIEQHVDQTQPFFLDETSKQEIQGHFKKIIEGPFFSKALRLLHEFRLLENYYIPDFKNLVGVLQDIYVHKFPTDMHILSALDELNKLELKREADPFLIDLYHSVKDRTALKLAVLLHDIGKGAKVGDQNEELVGARMVPGILAQLGYTDNPARVDHVVFLVEKHLTMRDLMLLDPEDDDTYDMTWDLVNHDSERLKMLVLLTFADRGGTKMKMTSTQIDQLKFFYQYTMHHQKHALVPNPIKLEFLDMVRLPRDLLSQLEIFSDFTQSKETYKAEFFFRPGKPADLILCTRDQKGVLYKISTVLAFNQLNIVEARIHTLGHKVFDVFKVVDSSENPIDYSNFFFIQKQIKDDLRRIFLEGESPATLYKGRTLAAPAGVGKYKEVKLKVKIIGRAVQLETYNIFGTFMMETKIFSEFNMEIERAVIHSQHDTASNIFYLRPKDVEKIMQNEEHFINKLKIALSRLIEQDSALLE